MQKIPRIIKLLLGVISILFGLVLIFPKNIHSFKEEPIRVEGFNPSNENRNDTPKRIYIPDLDIVLNIKESKIVNGFWEVFPDVAGWGEGSGIPGQPGNQVIFAHAKEGLFLNLKNAEPGMRISIYTANNYYVYEIKSIKEVSPSNTEVISPTSDETLTLYTCTGYEDSKRLIVIAKRV